MNSYLKKEEQVFTLALDVKLHADKKTLVKDCKKKKKNDIIYPSSPQASGCNVQPFGDNKHRPLTSNSGGTDS